MSLCIFSGDIWKRTAEKSQTNAINVTMYLLRQAVWGDIWKCTVEKSQTNATNVTLPLFGQTFWRHIWERTVEKSQINVTNGHQRWGLNPSKGSICKFGSPSGHITFDPAHWKVIFKSVHHPSLWGVYPEVLVPLAQNSWENSISLKRLGEKSQKPCFISVLKIPVSKCGFWDFSPKRFNEIEFSQLFWASAINTSG